MSLPANSYVRITLEVPGLQYLSGFRARILAEWHIPQLIYEVEVEAHDPGFRPHFLLLPDQILPDPLPPIHSLPPP